MSTRESRPYRFFGGVHDGLEFMAPVHWTRRSLRVIDMANGVRTVAAIGIQYVPMETYSDTGINLDTGARLMYADYTALMCPTFTINLPLDPVHGVVIDRISMVGGPLASGKRDVGRWAETNRQTRNRSLIARSSDNSFDVMFDAMGVPNSVIVRAIGPGSKMVTSWYIPTGLRGDDHAMIFKHSGTNMISFPPEKNWLSVLESAPERLQYIERPESRTGAVVVDPVRIADADFS